MDRFNVMANTMCVRLLCFADWLYGCSHRRTTFPITLRSGVGVDGQQSGQAETYLACLECGRHLAYDWSAMRITSQRAGVGRVQAKISEPNGGSRGEWLLSKAFRLAFRREAEADGGSR